MSVVGIKDDKGRLFIPMDCQKNLGISLEDVVSIPQVSAGFLTVLSSGVITD
jgi:bifunctional DNA-binding transcriptional regulator/antitoxin component of YhaV-PrlF toxin-antitoxin module